MEFLDFVGDVQEVSSVGWRRGLAGHIIIQNVNPFS